MANDATKFNRVKPSYIADSRGSVYSRHSNIGHREVIPRAVHSAWQNFTTSYDNSHPNLPTQAAGPGYTV